VGTGAAKGVNRRQASRRGAATTSWKNGSTGFWSSRELWAKIALELFVVFVGVSAAFALDDYREMRSENEKRRVVYSALDRELTQMAETHGPRFQKEMTQQLNAWDRAIAHGQKPIPPTFRLPGAERPPTGVWDAAVETAASSSSTLSYSTSSPGSIIGLTPRASYINVTLRAHRLMFGPISPTVHRHFGNRAGSSAQRC
jgi:hypothetical protein